MFKYNNKNDKMNLVDLSKLQYQLDHILKMVCPSKLYDNGICSCST